MEKNVFKEIQLLHVSYCSGVEFTVTKQVCTGEVSVAEKCVSHLAVAVEEKLAELEGLCSHGDDRPDTKRRKRK